VAVGYSAWLFAFSQLPVTPFRGPLDANGTLSGLPPPQIDHGEFTGLSRFTPDALSRMRIAFQPEGVRYVPADVPSTGPFVVSVNPIDDYTWGAAALSLYGDCLLKVVVVDRVNPRYGGTRYGVLPRGMPCVGAAATPENTRAPGT
jgi:hypothetical protein